MNSFSKTYCVNAACHGSLRRWCLAQAVWIWRLFSIDLLWELALLTLDVWCQEESGPERYCCWRRCWSRSPCIPSHRTRPLRAGTVSHALLYLKQIRSDMSGHAKHNKKVGKVSMCVLTMTRCHSKDRKCCYESWQFRLFYGWRAEAA